MADLHVAEIRGVGVEPARQYLWEVSMAAIPSAGGSVDTLKQMTFRAMSTTVPDKVTEVFEMMYKSAKVSFAGRDASGKTFDITFWDGEDLKIYNAFFGWLEYMKDHVKRDYITDVFMTLLGRDNNPISKFKLVDAFPENLQPLTLDYSVNDPINIPVTFRYDDCEQEAAA